MSIPREPVERVRHELEARKRMVMAMGVTAVWVGIAIIVMGAPDFIEDFFSPWSRYALGGAAFLGGLSIALGGAWGDLSRCGWWAQVAGLSVLIGWQVFMAACYTARVLDQGVFLALPGEPLRHEVTGRGYVPFLYVGLALGTAIPLITMLRNGCPSQSGEGPDSTEE
jgi:hypothetical protein